jgi:hypothetical protein
MSELPEADQGKQAVRDRDSSDDPDDPPEEVRDVPDSNKTTWTPFLPSVVEHAGVKYPTNE